MQQIFKLIEPISNRWYPRLFGKSRSDQRLLNFTNKRLSPGFSFDWLNIFSKVSNGYDSKSL